MKTSATLLRGQSTLEYVVIIAVVVAGLIGMQIYIKRGVQGKLRDSTDQIGEQFSPTAYKGNFTVVRKSGTRELLAIPSEGLVKGASKSEANLDIGDGKKGILQQRTADFEIMTNEQKNDAGPNKGKLFND